MALNIKDPEADRLARQVADMTGESITRAVVIALKEKLAREERRQVDVEVLVDDVLGIARSLAGVPVLDQRSDEAILGFDTMAE
ncbi:type II toxin-antitoxin system VapB family antitoxin [Phreatobacter sp.]|uniref:type II toxin-antitoxin system VapB family antitoxin n=1 Tax=Phreatobacter sp. TaxID=1966341 RepID=UPI0022C3BD52|nr:type II toxin-antitoxin system VapB family antitoxin [Phreatobacter sp.]MCZ8315890.1 type II toxin-antitoxin system VapB family antitoxin [Phreatobacter sp.]